MIHLGPLKGYIPSPLKKNRFFVLLKLILYKYKEYGEKILSEIRKNNEDMNNNMRARTVGKKQILQNNREPPVAAFR